MHVQEALHCRARRARDGLNVFALPRTASARLAFADPGLQRLLLAFMRRPARQPDHVEGGADAAVGIGKALGVDLRHPQHRGAAGRRPPPLDQDIGRAHAPQIRHQRERAVVAHHDAIDVGDRQRKARALQQRADIAQIGKRRDPRRHAAFAFGFRRRERLPQLGQRVAADHRRQQQPVRPQRAADLREHAGQIVDELKRQRGDRRDRAIPAQAEELPVRISSGLEVRDRPETIARRLSQASRPASRYRRRRQIPAAPRAAARPYPPRRGRAEMSQAQPRRARSCRDAQQGAVEQNGRGGRVRSHAGWYAGRPSIWQSGHMRSSPLPLERRSPWR